MSGLLRDLLYFGWQCSQKSVIRILSVGIQRTRILILALRLCTVELPKKGHIWDQLFCPIGMLSLSLEVKDAIGSWKFECVLS